MKVAYILKFILISAIYLIPISNGHAKEVQTLRLRGQIPYVFGLNYQKSDDYIEFRKVSNFEFYGSLDMVGQSLKFDSPIKLQDTDKHQIVTVTIN